MRLAWAILGGLTLGGGAAWWLARQDAPAPAPDARAAREGRIQVEDRQPGLYRWRDEDGILHITETPPRGRPYERLSREGEAGIQVQSRRAE